jgi:hypothetical protein
MNLMTDQEATHLKISAIRTDGGTQPRAEVYPEAVEEYAQAMLDGGVFPPVVVFFDGSEYWLADGFHRLVAAGKSGRIYLNAEVRQGSRRDAILHSIGANATHGLRRTNADKRRAVETLLADEEWSLWSDREIARRTNTSHIFVAKVRDDLTGNISSDDEDEERTYTTKHGTTTTMKTTNIGQRPNFDSGLTPEPDEEELELSPRQQSQAMQLLASSNRDDWRTPTKYIESVRQVLGAIDLDPASSDDANQVVKAFNYFDKELDGLAQLWYGRLFCNPPYGKTSDGKSMQGQFAAKLVEEYESGNVEQAILLVNLYYGYDWFGPLRDRPMCLVDHRIAFTNADTGEEGDEAKASSVFVYFGKNPTRFYTIFSQFGYCCRPTKFEWKEIEHYGNEA